MKVLSRNDVEKAFRKFTDLTDDLENAGHASWIECLKLLIHHCRTNPVMCVVTKPLRENRNVELDKWTQAAFKKRQYELPSNDDDRLALFYQIFEAIIDEKFNLLNFTFEVLGSAGSFDDAFYQLNEHFVRKFGRDVAYRLEEALDSIPDSDDVPPAAINVFEAGASNVQIEGGVFNSSIGNGATLYSQRIETLHLATAAMPTDIRAPLRDALHIVETMQLSEADKADIIDDLSKLLEALREKSPNCSRIERYVNRIKEIAPPVAAVLSSIKDALAIMSGPSS